MKNSLEVSAVILMCVRALGVFVQLGITILLARSLTLVEMGQFALIFSAIGLIRTTGTIGVDQASLRRISGLADPKKVTDQAQSLSNAGFVIALVIGFGIFTATLMVYWLIPSLGTAFLCFAMAAPAAVLIGLFIGQIRGLGYNIAAQVPDALGFPVLMLTGLLIVGDISAQNVLFTLVSTCWLTVLLQVVLRISIGINPKIRPSKQELVSLLQDGWNIFQAQIFTVLSQRAPVFLAAAILGSASTAIVEIAIRFGNLPSLLTGSVGATFSPIFAKLFATSEYKSLRKMRIKAGFLAGIPALAFLILWAITGEYIIEKFFPASYKLAYFPALVIATGSFLNATFGPASNVFLMSGHAKIVRKYSVLRFLTVVGVSFVVGEMIGSIGIALAIFAGFAVRDIGLSLRAWRIGY